jgi:hypothetical protein
MLKFILPKNAIKAVKQVVGAIFARAKKRFINKDASEKSIRISFSTSHKPVEHREDLSLRGVFEKAARAEGMKPNEELYRSVEKGVEDYLDAHQKAAEAKVLHAVQSHIHDKDLGSVSNNPDQVLKETVEEIFEKVGEGVNTIVDAELSKAKNISALDAIGKINTAIGIDDPVVCFIGPNDEYTCKDCRKLYFLEDEVTPRAWYTSELTTGYFKKGQDHPCVAALHPHCRHALCSILPGYGFEGGKITFIEHGYDVIKDQRKE